MKRALGLFSSMLLAGHAAMAASIFVPPATGDQLSEDQLQHVTDLVKNAIKKADEHELVNSEEEAEFVLQPSIVQRGDSYVLRIEKQRDGQFTSLSEQQIDSPDVSENQARVAALAVLSGAEAEDIPASQGDVRAPSPIMEQRADNGFFQLGVGPAFGIGLDSDKIMYNIHGGYNRNINEQFIGKVVADLNLGTGSDSSRLISILVGADWIPQDMLTPAGVPYVTGELGWGSARNADDSVQDAPVIGVGAGFKFAAQQINWDVNLHYSILTSQLDDRTPSVLGLRAAVGF